MLSLKCILDQHHGGVEGVNVTDIDTLKKKLAREKGVL